MSNIDGFMLFDDDDDWDEEDSAFDLELPFDQEEVISAVPPSKKDTPLDFIPLEEDAAEPDSGAAHRDVPNPQQPAQTASLLSTDPSQKTCPRCLGKVDAFTETSNQSFLCTLCNAPVPAKFVENYGAIPYVPLSLAGLRTNGKTCLLRGLFHAFSNGLGLQWPEFSYDELSDEDGDTLDKWLADEEDHTLPIPNQGKKIETVALRLEGVPAIDTVDLLMFDISGEVFEGARTVLENATHIQRAEVITLIVSINDVANHRVLTRMLQRLEQGLKEADAPPQKKTLLVVLTKGDLLLDDPTLPDSARDFLEGEQFPDVTDLTVHNDLSDALRDWLDGHPNNYKNFVRKAKRKFGEVRYTILSATGFDPPSNQKYEFEPSPRNVTAPLLLLLNSILPRANVKSASGSREYHDLCEAVEAAHDLPDENVTIELSAGRFRLNRMLDVRKPLTLIGRGSMRDDGTGTEIVGGLADTLIHSTARGLSIEGVSIINDGSKLGNVMTVSGGHFQLTDCELKGAVGSEAVGGNGLFVRHASEDDAAPDSLVTGCRVSTNRMYGIYIAGRSRVVVDKTTCEGNGKVGLRIGGRSTVSVIGGAYRGSIHGISVVTQATGIVKLAECSGNKRCGIGFFFSAKGCAELNTCQGQKYGILAGQQACPQIHRNTCKNNSKYGIVICDTAAPELVSNKTISNRQAGIMVETRGGVAAHRNECVRNGRYGIFINKHSTAALIERDQNECSNNGAEDFADRRRRRGWL